MQDHFLPHPNSYIDPAGVVYQNDDIVLRGIHQPFASFYENLLDHAAIRKMLGNQLVETQREVDGILEYPLTLRHRKISPLNYSYEWSPQMLKEAALLTLDICLELSAEDLTLQDASPWNIVFEHTHPYFVDFTSIVPNDPNLLWVAYDQFMRLFLFPLILFRYLPDRIVRGSIFDSINGISLDETIHLLPGMAWMSMPWVINRIYLPKNILSMIRYLDKEKSLSGTMNQFNPSRRQREMFFLSLKRDVLSISLKLPESQWTKYYSDIESFWYPDRFNQKQATVAQLLERIHPKTVLDIGCNRGGYDMLAAQSGARVVAFDTDTGSVGMLYQFAKERNLHILPLIMDFINPSPACGWRVRQFPSALDRFNSEMVLALALVHHLAITQLQSFDRIASALCDYTEKWLLTEFVPLDDPRSQELLATQRRNLDWYTLENFIAALYHEFRTVELFPSFPEGRTLILCTR